MITYLLSIALAVGAAHGLPAKSHATAAWQARARIVAEAIEAEVVHYPEARREALARAAMTWAGFESGYWPNPKGSNDAGAACGVLQTHLPPDRCKAARADVRVGVREGLDLIDRLWTRCGTLGAAMGSYSTGLACPKGIVPVVARRCKLAKMTSTCELK